MTSIDEMSETEAGEYIRAEITALRPILGELVPAFWQTLTDHWKRERAPWNITPSSPLLPQRTLKNGL